MGLYQLKLRWDTLHLAVLKHTGGFVSLQGEGVAYRGRILVELITQLNGKMDKPLDDIQSDDILVAQVLALQPSLVHPKWQNDHAKH